MDKINIGRLSAALDKLRACADGENPNPRLTQAECRDVCKYIRWLAGQFVKAKEVQNEKGSRDA